MIGWIAFFPIPFAFDLGRNRLVRHRHADGDGSHVRGSQRLGAVLRSLISITNQPIVNGTAVTVELNVILCTVVQFAIEVPTVT